MNNLCGVLNIYKEKGYTSHDVVALIRKTLNTKKVGHTGTLDPNAEGVLPICVGQATKISELITSGIKGYVATVHLGISTDTEDITGNLIEKNEITIDKNEIQEVVNSFVGKISQTPPMYSAIKINGKKLYELAREGKEIERKSRDIEIYSINILNFLDNDMFTIEVLCSKGTYIRTLCKDIGEKLGCGACMGDLTRIRSGDFYISDSIKLDEVKNLVSTDNLEKAFITFEKIFSSYKKVVVNDKANKFLYNGNKISINFINADEELKNNDKVLVYDNKKTLIGIYKVCNDDEKKVIAPHIMLYRNV